MLGLRVKAVSADRIRRVASGTDGIRRDSAAGDPTYATARERSRVRALITVRDGVLGIGSPGSPASIPYIA